MPGVKPVYVGTDGMLSEKASSLSNRSSMPLPCTSRLPRPLQTQKPLPSPPVAQVVNPDSPPKAQRTLIDAEYSESPMSSDWPIIHPENVAPRLGEERSSLPDSSDIAFTTPPPYDGACDDDGTRVRRLSWHSTHSAASTGTGPILRISADADAVILGTDDSIPEVPSIPAVIPTRLAQPRSMGALGSRGIRAMGSKTSLSATPPSAKADRTEAMRKVSPAVKISPIRSMQPPRNTGLDGYSPKSPSPLAPSAASRPTTSQASVAAHPTASSTPSGSHEPIELTSPVPESKRIASDLTAVQASDQTAEADKVCMSKHFMERTNVFFRKRKCQKMNKLCISRRSGGRSITP